MTILFLPPGSFSQAMYGSAQIGAIEATFDRFLSAELNGANMNAGQIGDIATQVTRAIDDHYEHFSKALPIWERENVERIAAANDIAVKPATVEYLANAYLFRAIRDYFELPHQDRFPRIDIGGLLVFTQNGSIIATPPENAIDRTFHYTRMPSRKNNLSTCIRVGELLADVVVGHRLKSTAFKSSGVRHLLYLPMEKASLFEILHQSFTSASVSVSRFVTRG